MRDPVRVNRRTRHGKPGHKQSKEEPGNARPITRKCSEMQRIGHFRNTLVDAEITSFAFHDNLRRRSLDPHRVGTRTDQPGARLSLADESSQLLVAKLNGFTDEFGIGTPYNMLELAGSRAKLNITCQIIVAIRSGLQRLRRGRGL